MTAITFGNRALQVAASSAEADRPASNLLDERLARVCQTKTKSGAYFEASTWRSVVGEMLQTVSLTATDFDVHPTGPWMAYVSGGTTLAIRKYVEATGQIETVDTDTVTDAQNLGFVRFEPGNGEFILVGRTNGSGTPWAIYRFNPATGKIGAKLADPSTKTTGTTARGVCWMENNGSATQQWFAIALAASPYFNLFDLTLGTGVISNKATDPTLPGSAASSSGLQPIALVYRNSSVGYMAVGESNSPYLHQYEATISSSPPAFASKHNNPATLPAGAVYALKYRWNTSDTDSYLFVGHANSPFVSAYLLFDGVNAIGAKAANPTTAFAGAPTSIDFSRPRQTNLLLAPSDLTSSAWTKTKTTIAADAAVAPSGMTTADKIKEDNTSGNHEVTQAITVTANTIGCYSTYLKAAERSRARLYAYISTNYFGGEFDLSAGTALAPLSSGATGLAAVIESVGDGIYRCWIAGLIASGTAMTVKTRLLDANGNESYTGTTDNGLYQWGAQYEYGAVPTVWRPYSLNGFWVAFNRNAANDGLELRLWTGTGWGPDREDIWESGTSGTAYKTVKITPGQGLLLTAVDATVDQLRLRRFSGEHSRINQLIDIVSLIRLASTQGLLLTISCSNNRDQSSPIYTETLWAPWPRFVTSGSKYTIPEELFGIYPANAHYVLPSPVLPRYIRVTLYDDQNEASGHACGYFFAGLLIRPTYGHQEGSRHAVNDESASHEAIVGPVYMIDLPRRRQVTFNFEVMMTADIHGRLQRLMANGTSELVLALPDDGDRVANYFRGIFGRLTQGLELSEPRFGEIKATQIGMVEHQ